MQKKLPLRNGVGAIVLNELNQVFVGKRKDNPIDKWQMPQGGVDEGEELISAMRRELYEETSISKIQILKELNNWYTYELPPYLLGKIWKGRFRGQRQRWFIVKYLGSDSDINIKTRHQEFIEWKWLDINYLPTVIVDLKKKIYIELLKEIKKFIN